MTDSLSCVCKRTISNKTPTITINGTIDTEVLEGPYTIVIWAANPIERNQSFTGSALPFPNETIAFGNNSIILEDYTDSSFNAKLLEPNSFYTNGGSTFVSPTVFVKVISKKDHTQSLRASYSVGEMAVPYRTLNYCYPKSVTSRHDSPDFYNTRSSLPYRSQYDILIDSAYPCQDVMASNFWGLKPPQ